MRKITESYDVVVIGGGPAGMMAAGRAAERGLRVVLLEKNSSLGKKLLITGGGRCNLTNTEEDKRKFLEKFKGARHFLFSPFSKFGVNDTLTFFNSHGMPTKIEPGNRVFPESDSSQSVWRVLVDNMKENKVIVKLKAEVSGFEKKGGKITGVNLTNGELVAGNSFILATGGKSYPETGSTGEGFEWLKKIGHKITEPNPTLVPIKTAESWSHKLSGLSFDDAKIFLVQNNKKIISKRGKLLLTHFGLSGPLILNSSKEVSDLLKQGDVVISIDTLPNIPEDELDRQLLELFKNNQNKLIKNILSEIIPTGFVLPVIKNSELDDQRIVNSISREERLRITKSIKGVRLTVQGLMGADKAIVTSGGVALEEIDFKTMTSKLYSNLHLVGDVLDIDRPSGGYSLQLCWTTGYIAGDSASSVLESPISK